LRVRMEGSAAEAPKQIYLRMVLVIGLI
jgi:hypothetical protein